MKLVLTFLPATMRFYSNFLSGIRRRLPPGCCTRIIDHPILREELANLLSATHPDGCIVDGAHGIGTFTPEVFGAIPVVYRDRTPRTRGNFLDVTLDYRANGEFAAHELMRPDVYDYAFLGSAEKTHWSRIRGQGFADTIRRNGLTLHRFEKERTDDETGRQALAKWLSALPKPCALFAANDYAARDAIDACLLAGLSVPDDVSVLGIDNTPEICENTTPGISSIYSDSTKSGWLCADLLCARINGTIGKSATWHYPTVGIVRRESTARSAPGKAVVRKALNAIRARACDGMSVNDVVAVLGCARRTAEKRFREATGKSIKQAISEVQMERVKIMLANPAIPIGGISAACGYGTDVALRIAFRARYGMSLSDWRMRNAR